MSRPGGSWPMISRTSCPRSRSARAWRSACSETPPQNDHENGTTIPIFTPPAYSRRQPPSSASQSGAERQVDSRHDGDADRAGSLRRRGDQPRGARRAAHAPGRVGRLLPSSGRSPTTRASRCRSRTTGTSTRSSRSTRAASKACRSSMRSTSGRSSSSRARSPSSARCTARSGAPTGSRTSRRSSCASTR